MVMAVHNGERFLAQAIDSVLCQTFTDFEFIIVDDGSTDATATILDAYRERDRRLELIRQPNAGYIAALNSGCDAARGEFIARIDADDLCEPARFGRQIEFLDSRPEIAVVGGAMLLITADGRPFYLATFPQAPTETRAALEHRNPLGHPTVMMRRSAFLSVAGYRAAFAHAEDYDLWLRISAEHELANLPDILGRYRIHPDNASHRNLKQQALSVAAARAAMRGDGVGAADTAEITMELGLWWGTIGTRAGRGYRRLARQGWRQALEAARTTADPTGNRRRVLVRQTVVADEQGRRLHALALRAKLRLHARTA